MKKLFFIYFLLLACSPKIEDKNPTDLIDNNTKISVLEEVYDFGEILQGEKVIANFIVKNIGDSDFIISHVKTTCGCTVANWNKDPISSGREEVIEVVFNSTNKIGKQEKTVSLLTNATPNTIILTIKGNVIISEK